MPSKIGNMQIKIMDVKGKTINRIPNACVWSTAKARIHTEKKKEEETNPSISDEIRGVANRTHKTERIIMMKRRQKS